MNDHQLIRRWLVTQRKKGVLLSQYLFHGIFGRFGIMKVEESGEDGDD